MLAAPTFAALSVGSQINIFEGYPKYELVMHASVFQIFTTDTAKRQTLYSPLQCREASSQQYAASIRFIQDIFLDCTVVSTLSYGERKLSLIWILLLCIAVRCRHEIAKAENLRSGMKFSENG